MKAKLKRQMLKAEMGRQEPEDIGQRAEGRGSRGVRQHSVPKKWFPFFVLTAMTLSQTGCSAEVRVPKVSANYNCSIWLSDRRIAP